MAAAEAGPDLGSKSSRELSEAEKRREERFYSDEADPVFDGMVKDFTAFDEMLQGLYEKLELFIPAMYSLSAGLSVLSDAVFAAMPQMQDRCITSDSYKLREATNQIVREDAPHSAIAKFKRDVDWNVMEPIKSHLENNKKLKEKLEARVRRLEELRTAKSQVELSHRWQACETDMRFAMAKHEFEASLYHFQKVDREIFLWLYTLEEYRGDIMDSYVQTMKYLLYEFFSASAHAISGALPARMEFRPMVEMLPEHLEAQVELELQDAGQEEGWKDLRESANAGFSLRLAERLARDRKGRPEQAVNEAEMHATGMVDALSLSSLLSQGFEEGPARRALRLHDNDTQAALDWLIEQGGEDAPRAPAGDGVRAPATAHRSHVLDRAARRRPDAARQDDRGSDGAAPPPTALGVSRRRA